MKFMASLLLSLAVGWTTALPQGPTTHNGNILNGRPDGGYLIGWKDDGTPFIEAYYPPQDADGHNQTLPTAGPPSLGQKMPGTDDHWGCVGDEFVDPYTWTQAASSLASWCDAGNVVGYKKILTWIRGDSEAYICNWAGEQNCSGDEYYSYMRYPLDYFCSPYHSGWFLQGSGNKGYGRGVYGGRGESAQVCFNP